MALPEPHAVDEKASVAKLSQESRNNASFTTSSTQTSFSLKDRPNNEIEAKIEYKSLGIDSTPGRRCSTVREEGDEEDEEKGDDDHDYRNKLKRRLNPRSREDVRQLYIEVEQWRDYKLKKIDDESGNGPSTKDRNEERSRILDQETKLLRKISTLRKNVLHAECEKKLNFDLYEMSNEKIWIMGNGAHVIIETPSSQYASKLVVVYGQLSDYMNQNENERIEVLQKAKEMVDQIDSRAAKDASDLMEREIELLDRRMTQCLSGLRKRLLNIYLQVLKQERQRM